MSDERETSACSSQKGGSSRKAFLCKIQGAPSLADTRKRDFMTKERTSEKTKKGRESSML